MNGKSNESELAMTDWLYTFDTAIIQLSAEISSRLQPIITPSYARCISVVECVSLFGCRTWQHVSCIEDVRPVVVIDNSSYVNCPSSRRTWLERPGPRRYVTWRQDVGVLRVARLIGLFVGNWGWSKASQRTTTAAAESSVSILVMNDRSLTVTSPVCWCCTLVALQDVHCIALPTL